MSYVGFTRPKIKTILERIFADINSQIPDVDARTERTVLNVLAKVLSGSAHEMYGYLDWTSDQTNVLTCEDENLDAYGIIWGITRKQATVAVGTVKFTGEGAQLVPSGTQIKSKTSNVVYVTTADATTSGTTPFQATISTQAVEVGVNANQVVDTTLNLVNPVAGILSNPTVVTMIGGTDRETDTNYRARILARINLASHGGAKHDYVNWAKEFPGVTRAWCYPLALGIGTVTVRFMMDNDRPPNGIPEEEDEDALFAYMNVLRPVTADLFVVAPAAVALNITVTGLVPNTQAVKDASVIEFGDMIRRKAEPGLTIRYSWLMEAISLATGNDYHRITTPANVDVTHTTNQIAVPGTITWA